MSEFTLINEIINLSVQKTWDKAKQEWKLDRVYQKPGQTCLCGHSPISEICVIRNERNGEETSVGNCCVKNFLGFASNKLFAAIKRVRKDINKPFNADIVEMAFNARYLNDWEREFYLNTWRKRDLTERQERKRKSINTKLLRLLS